MAIKGGYWGKILSVDLTNKKIVVNEFDNDFAKKYLGGVGFATKLVSDKVEKNTDPLGPDNVLVFSTGPYQASKISSSGRCSVAAKSPLTGYWGEANGGGHIGPEIKKAGYDAIEIIGASEKPVYICIKDDNVEIKNADKLWGMDTADVTDVLQSEMNDSKAAVTSIGRSGEQLVRYACIANEKHGYFGRCGLGAVMGSKKLKAITIKGSKKPLIAEPEKLKEIYNKIFEKMKVAPFTKDNRENGQVTTVVSREENGLLPMKNWTQDNWTKGAAVIGAPNFTKEMQVKPWGCPNCIMGCHRKITNPKYKGKTGGLEYESIAMFGSNLLIDDLSALAKTNELCNTYGIDTIELGGILGWAFESYEKGLITKEDTGGIELVWGSGEALVKITEKICKREGFGNLLSQGLRACVKKIPESKDYSFESMGQAIAGHDPRAYFGEVITTIASTRGACHIHGFAEAGELGVMLPEIGVTEAADRFDATGKGYLGAVYQDVQQVWNSLVFCMFHFFSDFNFQDQVDILNAITGWDLTPNDLYKTGERIVCMQQLFNIDMGMIPESENVMPKRFTTPHKGGGSAGQVPPWKDILNEYWDTKGWIKGIPTAEKKDYLGIE